MFKIEHTLFNWLDKKIGYKKSDIVFDIYLWVLAALICSIIFVPIILTIYWIVFKTNNFWYSELAGFSIAFWLIGWGILYRKEKRKYSEDNDV